MRVTTTWVLAVVFAAVSGALMMGGARERRLADGRAVPRRRHRSRAWTIGQGVGLIGLVGAVVIGLSASLLVVAAAAASGVTAQVVLTRRDARIAANRSRDVARACRVLAAQLRIGQVPSVALRSAALDCPPLERPAATQAICGDVAAALRDVGRAPGYEGLRDLAMAWALAERSGAPIASLATRVSGSLRTLEANRAAVSAELAASRASGRILAALPALGLAMGSVTGGDPLRFLLTSLPGRACVLGGVLLAGCGVLWTEHLADKAAR